MIHRSHRWRNALGAAVSGVTLNRNWPWTLDANGDRQVTLADVSSWFFYPGDLCVYWLLTQRTPQIVQLRERLEITHDAYHGAFSIILSFAVWAFAFLFLWGLSAFSWNLVHSLFSRDRRFKRP